MPVDLEKLTPKQLAAYNRRQAQRRAGPGRAQPDTISAADRPKVDRQVKQQDFERRRREAFRKESELRKAGKTTPQLSRARLQQAGFLPGSRGAYKAPKGVAGVLAKTIGNVSEAAVYTPAGTYQAGKAVVGDVKAARRGDVSFKRTRHVAAETGKAFAEDIRHPLRRPGYTLLDALALGSLGGSAAVRATAASRQVARGAGARAALTAKPYEGGSLLRKPIPGKRTLRLNELEVQDRYALNPGHQAVQKLSDKLRGPKGNERRIAMRLADERKIVDAAARGPADALIRAGRNMTEPQRMALRVYHEGAPIENVIERHKGLARTATGQRRRDLTHKVGLLEAARKYVHTVDGKPELRADFKRPRKVTGRHGLSAEHLRAVSERIDRVAGDYPGGREALLKELGLLDKGSAEFRKNAPGRIMLGAEFDRTARRGKRGQTYIDLQGKTLPARTTKTTRERSVAEAEARVAVLEKRVDKGVETVVKAMQSDPALRQRTVSKDLRPRKEYKGNEEFKLSKHGPSAAEPVKRELKPIRLQEGAKAARAKAEEAIFKHGSKPGAHPTLKRLADAMRELDDLKAGLLERKEAGFMQDVKPRSLGTVEQITSVRVPTRFGEEIGRKDKGRLVGHEDFQGGRTRIPDTPMVQRPAARRPAVFRGGIPQKPASTTHEYTGALRRSGNYRTDTERLVAESAHEAQRYASVERLRQRVIKAGVVEKPEGKGWVPVRTEKLKKQDARRLQMLMHRAETMGEHLTAEERQVVAHGVKEFTDDAFPAVGQFAHEPAGTAIRGVVWVPKSFVDGVNRDAQRALLGPAGRYFDTAQNVIKGSILFAKPTAYVTANAAGNALFNIAQQGVLAPLNWRRAGQLGKHPDLAAGIDGVMGGGFIRSATAGTEVAGGLPGVISQAVHSAGNVLGGLSDLVFRRAAFVHEARRYGFKTDAQLDRLLHAPEHRQTLIELAGRARSAIVDYERLGPFERDVIRRAMFVYPWVKGATLYAGHFVSEHPVQSAVLGKLAEQGHEQAQKDIGETPSYARGIFKVGGTRDMPLVVNPQNLNPFSTPAGLGYAIKKGVTGEGGRADAPIGLLSPLLRGAVEEGGTYGGGLPKLGRELVQGSAPGVLSDQLHRTAEEQKDRAYPVTPAQALLRFAVGSEAPRTANRKKLNADAFSEGTGDPGERAYRKVYAKRNEFFAAAQQHAPEMLHGQHKLSARVRRSFNLEAERQRDYAAASHGKVAGSHGYQLAKYRVDLELLARHGVIDRTKVQPLLKAAAAADVEAIKDARRGISEKYYQAEGGPLYWINEAKKYLEAHGATVPR